MQSVYLLTPVNKEVEEWIEENVYCENWQRLGRGMGIKYRYITDIVKGLIEEGFKNEVDFTVC